MTRRPWLGLVGLAWLALTSVGAAETVTIDTHGDPAARLEIRQVVLPGGIERALYVVTAERVTVRSGELTIVASRLEFDPDAERVLIVGRGRVERPDETLTGRDLVVSLGDGRLEGSDVWVLTDRVNVYGARADRVDGRIRLLDGDVAPCGRCGQSTEDYGFLAERVEILPGDRLIAWEVLVLVRERPLIDLPLLVLPIAEPERIPRLSLELGGASSRALIGLDWPYVAGPNAYGTLRARLRLDVDPDAAGPLDARLFGGRVEAVYPEGGVVHRFYDERGSGSIELDARPAYEDEVRTRPVVRFEAVYAQDPRIGASAFDVRIARDDVARPDLVEAEARLSTQTSSDASRPGVRVRVEHLGVVPLVAGADAPPSWDGPSEPRGVPLLLAAETVGPPIRSGALSLASAGVEAGAYEDDPNPANRAALSHGDAAIGRLEVRARLELAPLALGPVEIDGVNDFLGRYYTTAERQVDWDARLRARLPIADAGSLSVTLRRDAAEGETPFAFDRLRLRTRSDLRAALDVTPFSGAWLRAEAGTVLEDDRSVGELGWLPTFVRLDLFQDVEGLTAAVEHRADPGRDDVGRLRWEASAELSDRTYLALASVAVTTDLAPTLPTDRGASVVRDTGDGTGSVSLGLRNRLVARVDAGYDAEPEAGADFTWRTVRSAVTVGTLGYRDDVPGFEAFWEVDPNDGSTEGLGYLARAEVGPLRAELDQRFGPAGGTPGTHRYAVIWTDVARLSLEGPELLRSGWFGLAPDSRATRSIAVRLRDDQADPGTRFDVAWRTDLVPSGSTVERRRTRLEASLRLDERRFDGGRSALAIDGYLDMALADDGQPGPYLRRASLTAGADLAGRVGLQGTVGYRASYDLAAERVRSGRLTLDEVSLIVRASRELYLGATLDDVWELVDPDPSSAVAFDPRPTLFLTWDRCCWALYASWDTSTGEVVVTLGGPGSREGAQFALAEGEGPSIPWSDSRRVSDVGPGASP